MFIFKANVDRLAVASISIHHLHITNRKLKLHHWSVLLCTILKISDIRSPTAKPAIPKWALIKGRFHFCILNSIQKYAIFKFTPCFAFFSIWQFVTWILDLLSIALSVAKYWTYSFPFKTELTKHFDLKSQSHVVFIWICATLSIKSTKPPR